MKDCGVLGGSFNPADCIFKSINRHFGDHKDDFGFNNVGEYIDSATELLLRKPGNGVEIRYDKISKTIRKYDISTNTMISYQNGKILTYFKPNKGIEYWNDEVINGKLYSPK